MQLLFGKHGPETIQWTIQNPTFTLDPLIRPCLAAGPSGRIQPVRLGRGAPAALKRSSGAASVDEGLGFGRRALRCY